MTPDVQITRVENGFIIAAGDLSPYNSDGRAWVVRSVAEVTRYVERLLTGDRTFVSDLFPES